MTEIDRNGLEVLNRADCLQLLRTASLGRIGITAGALPTILPINFRVDGERILFRTGVGTKLDAATRGTVVAFEADDIDPMYHSGWSVVVTGVAREVDDPDDRGVLRRLLDRLADLVEHRVVERVQDLGSIERDEGDGITDLVTDELHRPSQAPAGGAAARRAWSFERSSSVS